MMKASTRIATQKEERQQEGFNDARGFAARSSPSGHGHCSVVWLREWHMLIPCEGHLLLQLLRLPSIDLMLRARDKSRGGRHDALHLFIRRGFGFEQVVP